jgi:hypothetical protein
MAGKMRLKYNPKAYKGGKKNNKPKMRPKGPDGGIVDNDFYGETDKPGFTNIKFHKEYK